MLQKVYYCFLDQNKTEAMIKISNILEINGIVPILHELPLPINSQNAVFISDSEEHCMEATKANYPAILADDLIAGKSSMQVRYVITSVDAVSYQYLEEVFSRFYKIPLKILETERCMLRETCLEDLNRFYEIYSADGMTDFLEPLFEEYEKEETYLRSYIEHIYAFYGYGMWSVIDKESGAVIGRAGVEYKEEEPDSLELGYLIDKGYQRKGYATEVCTAIMNYAADNLETSKLCSFIHSENMASVNLCEKLGFKEQGSMDRNGVTFRKYVWEKNQ